MHTMLLMLQERLVNDGYDLHLDFGLPLLDPIIVTQAHIPNVIREEIQYDFNEQRVMAKEKISTLNL